MLETSTTHIIDPPPQDVRDCITDVCNLVGSPAAQYDDAERAGVPLTDAAKLRVCEETLAAIDTRVRKLMGWQP